MDDRSLYEKKILLVDDEPELLALTVALLSGAGFTDLHTARTAGEAIAAVREKRPDLAVLDVMLPDMDGFRLLEELRRFSEIPVLFLSARDQAEDRLAGLGLGADDYIVKPFLPRELLLRILAVLRRCYREELSCLRLAACTVDLSRAEVRRGGEILSLTAKEHALLETLAAAGGRIVTVDALCRALWGDNPFGYENSLNAHVRRLREKIEAEPSHPVSLVTVKGLGYRLLTGR